MHFKFGEIQTFVSDLSSAIDFYRNILGLKFKQASKDWAIFDIQGIEFVLMAGATKNRPNNYGQTCGTVMCLQTISIELDIEKLRLLNVVIMQEIQSVSQGKFAVIADPDGNFIEIIQRL